jgi:hypothetical protein
MTPGETVVRAAVERVEHHRDDVGGRHLGRRKVAAHVGVDSAGGGRSAIMRAYRPVLGQDLRAQYFGNT